MVHLFFAAYGRMGRVPFLAAVAVLVLLFAGYEWAVVGVAHTLTAWLVHFLLLVSAACVLSKRLHDRGRSGWWSAVYLFAFAVNWPRPDGVIAWLFLPVLVGAAVDLGVMPGQRAFNRFGAPPG